MAKLPIYTRQQVTRGARSSAADFGAGAAQEMGQMGNTLSALGEKTRMRHEVISRVRTQNSFDAMVTESANTLINGADLTDPQVLNDWRGETKSKIEEMIGQHAGSEQSKLQLRSTLENQFGQYQKMLLGEQIKAQHKLIGSEIDFYNRDHAAELNFAPELWEDTMNGALAKHEADYGQILNPDTMTAYRNSTIATMALAASNSYLQNKDPESAKKILDDPRVQKALTADQSRTLAKNIIVEQAKGANLKLRNERLVKTLEFVTGKQLTEEEVAAVYNLPEQDDMTFVDTAALARITLNRELSPAEMQKAAGLNLSSTDQSGIYGNSIRGRMLSMIDDMVPTFENGTIVEGSPEYNQFMTSVVNGYTERRKDPVTGNYETVMLPMPNHVRAALNARGVNLSEVAQTFQSTSFPPAAPSPAAPAQMPTIPAAGGQQPVQPSQDAVRQLRQKPAEMPSFWDMSTDVSGPIPALKETLGSTPFTENITQGGGIATTYRNYINNEKSALIGSIQLSPKFNEGERKSLEERIDFGTKIWDNPKAFKLRLLAIDATLSERIQKDQKIMMDPSVGPMTRQTAARNVAAIIEFREKLGIPPLITSDQEYQQIPVGTVYRTADGTERTKGEQ